jgi:hypothetical protein
VDVVDAAAAADELALALVPALVALKSIEIVDPYK